MRIIGFNGPPRSGKDTIAAAVLGSNDFAHIADGSIPPPIWGQPSHVDTEALIMPCRIAAFTLLGLGTYDRVVYENIKDMPLRQIAGNTLRRFMIDLSELHLKHLYGKDFYGKSLATKLSMQKTRVVNNEELLLVTDIGFQEEVEVLSDLVAPENFLLVHLSRKGATFEGDSRGWCYHPNLVKWHNDLSPEVGAEVVMGHAYHELGWEF